MSLAAWLGVGAVRAYQWTLRPMIGANCRFEPSCSDYAIEALRAHGAVCGAAFAGWRILRCNPWHAGGYDPVPAAHHAGRDQPGRDQPGRDQTEF
ncbi:MAG: membrane protein insertion efficiency factor YidD [Pseudomonadota bacterium]|nr:membrane protein insertion efficiency factor YidD [Pseudomonadota bacterium]